MWVTSRSTVVLAEAFSTDGMGINRREIRPGKTFNAVDISVDIICLDTGSHMS